MIGEQGRNIPELEPLARSLLTTARLYHVALPPIMADIELKPISGEAWLLVELAATGDRGR